ncbi:unnamed protein product [Gadus morhua 'NCC']
MCAARGMTRLNEHDVEIHQLGYETSVCSVSGACLMPLISLAPPPPPHLASPYGSRAGTRRLRSKLPLEDCMPQAMKAWFYSDLQPWFYSDLQAWFYCDLQAWFYSDRQAWFYSALQAWFYSDLQAWFYSDRQAWFYSALQAWFYSDLQAWFYSDWAGKPQRSKQACEMGAGLEEELRQQSPGIAGPPGGRSRTRPRWRRLEATICHQGMTGP